jgi:hypothetical protein
MKRFTQFCAIIGFSVSAVFAQNIAAPVFVLKDGDATAAGYNGTDNAIYIDGNAQQSVGWITFQTQGIDVSKIASAKLLLYVKSLSSRGTIEAHVLTSDISAPENNVRLSAIVFNPTAAASAVLGTADIEKVIQFDLTALVKGGTFKGVALTSDDGLAVMFDSKEGHLAPVILLTTNVDDVAEQWHSGPGVPAAGLGKDGDCYLNTSSGDVYSKASEAWAVVTNIVGPQGQKGDKGDPGLQGAVGLDGAQGPKGDQGLTGATGPTGSPGPKGDQGLTGATGAQGASGAVGPRGDKGDQGIQGIAGAQGPKGDKGDPGLQGPIGLTGAQGPKGDQGSIGAAGPMGLTGATGATGSFPAGNAPGDMQYWNGTAWAIAPVGQPGQFLQVSSAAIPTWSGAAYPAVTTAAISSIAQTTATSGGTVTSDGGAFSTARGVCWNTSANPTIANSKTADGTGAGAFTSSITGLASNRMYYVRAYAANSAGTVYGNQVSFTTN